jgi:hypothetical protein
MGFPVFPPLPCPPPRKNLIGLLLETIIFEQQALAHLINAEAEKVQSMAHAGIAGPISPSEAAEINKSVAEVIKFAAEKEEKLFRKLQAVLSTPVEHGKPDCQDV